MESLANLIDHVKIHAILNAAGDWVQHEGADILEHVAEHGALFHVTDGDSVYALTLVKVNNYPETAPRTDTSDLTGGTIPEQTSVQPGENPAPAIA